MSEGKGFRKLLVWQRAHDLVLLVYKMTQAFPKAETFGLTSQLRRASSSIPANISEGNALGSDSQFLRHLRIAQGSLAEVEYFLILAKDLQYLAMNDYEQVDSLRGEVGYLLHRLLESIEKRQKDVYRKTKDKKRPLKDQPKTTSQRKYTNDPSSSMNSFGSSGSFGSFGSSGSSGSSPPAPTT